VVYDSEIPIGSSRARAAEICARARDAGATPRQGGSEQRDRFRLQVVQSSQNPDQEGAVQPDENRGEQQQRGGLDRTGAEDHEQPDYAERDQPGKQPPGRLAQRAANRRCRWCPHRQCNRGRGHH
jgi:hypothetical protein